MDRALKEHPVDESPARLNAVHFRRAWVFHRTGPNLMNRMRGVMPVIMIRHGIRVMGLFPTSVRRTFVTRMDAVINPLRDTPRALWRSRHKQGGLEC